MQPEQQHFFKRIFYKEVIMVWAGTAILVLTFVAIFKRFETRLCLILGGVIMGLLVGNPMPVFNAFAQTMVHPTFVTTICSCMGFAYALKYTGCDMELVRLLVEPIKKAKLIIVPASLVITWCVNITITSAAGSGATVGAILIPTMLAAGVHPAMAASVIVAGTWGSMLNPGTSNNPLIAKIANVDPMTIIAGHATACFVALAVCVTTLSIIAFILKEHTGHENIEAQAAVQSEVSFKLINYVRAFVPILPLLILVLASKQVGLLPPVLSSVPLAMLIGTFFSFLATLKSPAEICKEFFNGMGFSFAHIIGLIVAATMLTKGMEVIGLTGVLIDSMKTAKEYAGLISAFGPFAISIICGSGDAATLAFNTAVTPHAAEFGMEPGKMGSLAFLSSQLGRSMSPVAGVTLICAGIASVSPIEVAKRNALPMFLAALAGMFMLT